MCSKIDKLGFLVNNKRFFPIGFNYWPRDMAVYLWEEYSSEAIKKDMAKIAELGANCLRIFIRWEDLNPEMGMINREFFIKFEDFLTHASNNRIKLIPTLLIGHMSGQDWFPGWFTRKDNGEDGIIQWQTISKPPYKKEKIKCRDIYTDPIVLENTILQIKELLSRYKSNDTIISYDLSNENQYWMRPKTPEIGTEYMKKIYNRMKKIDPNHPITYGMGKLNEITGFISFGPKGFAQYNDYYAVHVYPVWLYPRTKEIFDFYVCYKIAFDCCLAKVCDKPVQLQEFGLSDMFFTQRVQDQKDQLLYGYFNIALWDCLLNEIRGGALIWDFCDFLPELMTRNPYDHKNFEMKFGVVDKDYSLKPSGAAFKNFSRFLEKVDIFNYEAPKAKVAIVLPDNFNNYPEIENPKEKYEEHNENHNKSLFSSFIFLKMCHCNFDFISLNELNPDLNAYDILFVPNLYNLSKRSENKLLKFLNSKENRIVYFSSNFYIPNGIFGDLKWKTAKKSKYNLICKPVDENFDKIFPDQLTFKAVKHQIILEKLSNQVIPILHDFSNNNEVVLFQKIFKKNNKAIFLTTAPEINHTFVKNSYKNESGYFLYKNLLHYVHLEKSFDCNNSLLEVQILYHHDDTEAILIIINHDFSEQTCQLKLKRKWKEIQEIYNSNYKASNNEIIEFLIHPYEKLIFLLKY